MQNNRRRERVIRLITRGEGRTRCGPRPAGGHAACRMQTRNCPPHRRRHTVMSTANRYVLTNCHYQVFILLIRYAIHGPGDTGRSDNFCWRCGGFRSSGGRFSWDGVVVEPVATHCHEIAPMPSSIFFFSLR